MKQWAEKLNIKVVERHFGGVARDERDYENRASEMYCEARRMLPEMQIPNSPELVADLTSRKYEHIVKNGRLIIESKKAVKKRTKKSPDHGDAFVMACSEGRARPVIAESHSVEDDEVEW